MRAAIALLFACAVGLLAHHLEISGRILSSQGSPLPVADAELRRPGRYEPVARVRASADGSFTLKSTGQGLFLLRLVGVHHQPVEIPILLTDRDVRERVEVQLATLDLPPVRDSVLLAASNALPTTTAGTLLSEQDGLYRFAARAAPGKRYRLVIRGGGKSIVTIASSDSAVLGFDGFYIGIGRDSLTVFDPAELPRTNLQPVVRCQSPAWQEVADAYLTLMQYWRASIDSNNALIERAQRSGLVYDPRQLPIVLGAERWRDSVHTRLSTVRTELAEQLWLLLSVFLPPQGSDDPLHRRALQRVPPSSPLWALDPQLVYLALASRPREQQRMFLDQLIETNPDTTAKAQVAFAELVSSATAQDKQRARWLYRVLTTECPTHPLATAARRYNPDRLIQVGNPLPEFRLTATGNSPKSLTPATFAGKPLLVAIVTPQCQPCQQQLEELSAWMQSTSRQLQVLVVIVGTAADSTLDATLQRFRHTTARVNSFLEPELLPFEVESFPMLILADARGVIVATTEELRDVRRDVERFLSREQ